jgi:hypothetical protein
MKRSPYAVWPGSVLALALLVGSVGNTRSWAEDHHKEHAKPHAGKAAAASASGAAGVWHEIQEQVGELALLVKRKKLSQVHEVAFEIRDLVRTLPAKSPSLGAAQRKKLAGYVKQVDLTAKLLDETGDANNQKATESHHQHLLQVLQNIKRLYPSGALASRAPGKAHDHK